MLSLVLLVAAVSDFEVWSAPPALTQEIEGSSARILVIGDWGGQGSRPFYTKPQVEVAKSMGQFAAGSAVDAGILLGDNFYDSGVQPSGAAKRFNETFDGIYTASSLMHIPYYAVLGNHDHSGNINSQIDFTTNDPHRRWKMPAQWYSLKMTASNWTADFFFIDTVVISGNSDVYGKTKEARLRGYPGPLDLLAVSAQIKWLTEQLEASTADYVFVAGHYPVYSGGEHGSTSELERDILPLLKKYNATAYLSGHDHTAQFLEQDGVAFIQQGMGMECCYGNSHERRLPKGILKYAMWDDGKIDTVDGGFCDLQLSSSDAKIVYVDDEGNTLYSSTMKPRPRRY